MIHAIPQQSTTRVDVGKQTWPGPQVDTAVRQSHSPWQEEQDVTRGRQLTVEQIETVKATYAMTRNYAAAARAAGCSLTAARNYVQATDDFEQLRAEKTAISIDSIIVKIGMVQERLLDAMLEQSKVDRASMQELATSLGIVTDKRQLLAGDPTSRSENLNSDPTTKLTAAEMEQAARIRERLAEKVPT